MKKRGIDKKTLKRLKSVDVLILEVFLSLLPNAFFSLTSGIMLGIFFLILWKQSYGIENLGLLGISILGIMIMLSLIIQNFRLLKKIYIDNKDYDDFFTSIYTLITILISISTLYGFYIGMRFGLSLYSVF